MLTSEENLRLTQVGPGTPGGNLLRRYWHPVATVAEMQDQWAKPVRLLGEELALFKDRQGRYGLIEEQCAHRRASLSFGIPTQEGIRCPYHGWHFDRNGQCIDQPNEPESSKFKDRVKLAAYPVEELSGLLWAYLGPLPAPLIPRYDGFVVEPAIRMIGTAVLPMNWLQFMENNADPIHTEWLHGHYQEFQEEASGAKYAISRKHRKIRFPEFEYGIVKQRLLEGQPEDCDDWQIGHPIVFPNILSVGNGDNKSWRTYSFQIRVPMNDTETMHYYHTSYAPPEGVDVPLNLLNEISSYEVPFRDEKGRFILDAVDVQDIWVCLTQGRIADRTRERLGTTDKGVIAFRNMLSREIAKVENGQEPICVVRDPARNTVIDLPIEKNKHHFSDGLASLIRRTHARYSPIAEDVIKLFAGVDKGRAKISGEVEHA